MIKRLQHKIAAIITCLMAAVLLIIVFTINAIAQGQSNERINTKLNRIAERDGNIASTRIDPYFDENGSYAETFSVMINYNNEVLGIVSNRDVLQLADQIISLADDVLKSGSTNGRIGNMAYSVHDRSYGRIVVFLDVSAERQNNENLMMITGVIFAVGIIVLMIIAILLSKWLVRPVKETFDKQKVFISDASHELKTPLAVISANVDVLQSEIGENKWLEYISSETMRMSELVNELLSLARLDDKNSSSLNMSDFSLTDLVLQTALPFESRMFESGKKFTVEADENIDYHGDQSAIRHILTILIDNAEKYSGENGEISVKLTKHGAKRIIEVFNTGRGIPQDKLDKVFERFYREDEVRNSKSGGYGLGLSIAKSIAEAHRGSITVQSEYGKWVCFTVAL